MRIATRAQAHSYRPHLLVRTPITDSHIRHQFFHGASVAEIVRHFGINEERVRSVVGLPGRAA